MLYNADTAHPHTSGAGGREPGQKGPAAPGTIKEPGRWMVEDIIFSTYEADVTIHIRALRETEECT